MTAVLIYFQGIFYFQNGVNGNEKSLKQANNSSKIRLPKTVFNYGTSTRSWNVEFERTWNQLKRAVDDFQESNNNDHLEELFDFVTANRINDECSTANDASTTGYLRVATLLTGINKPDHFQYFKTLANRMQTQKIARTILLPARDCPTVRAAIETLVSSVLNKGRKHKYQDDVGLVAFD